MGDRHLIKEQIQRETSFVQKGVERYERLAQKAMNSGQAASLKAVERLMLHWYTALKQAILAQKRSAQRNHQSPPAEFTQPLALLPSNQIAVITMTEVLNACLSSPIGAPMVPLCGDVGKAFNAQVNLKGVRKNKEAWKKLCRSSIRGKSFRFDKVNRIAQDYQAGQIWPMMLRSKLGAYLVWTLIEVASSNPYQQSFEKAFYYSKRTTRNNGRAVGVLRLTNKALAIIDDGHQARKYLRPLFGPMITPPVPWTDFQKGGYLKIRAKVAKIPLEPLEGQYDPIAAKVFYDGINALGATPWRINQFNLQWIEELWRGGGGSLGIPIADDLALPPKPHDIDENYAARFLWRKSAVLIHDENVRLRSIRKVFLMGLDAARDCRDRRALWFPYQADFRGRVYPMPIALNFHNQDLMRGLLEFAEGKPLGPNGRYWLMVHAANCYGVDKVSFNDRVKWIEANLPLIRESVAQPESPWWQRADHPWQFRAVCRELIAITSDASISHTPVFLDGTCNGLQHYAALTRDPLGASRVNLIPGDRPADIYSDVMEVVSKQVTQEVQTHHAAQLLDGKITRSLIKQPVMTTVYGVTRAGAVAQILKALEKTGLNDSIDEEYRYPCAAYLADKTLAAMKWIAPGMMETMRWMRVCARKIVQSGHVLVWRAPSGILIEQPYRSMRSATIRVLHHLMTIRREDRSMPPKAGRQTTGFAPNYIHGLDASHLLMTASQMKKKGKHLAAVHDSFGTHAIDIDTMLPILKEQFVRLHGEHRLTDLHEQLTRRYRLEFPLPPHRPEWNWDLNEVLQSTYAFC